MSTDVAWKKVKNIIMNASEPYRKQALKILEEYSKAKSMVEKRVYKARLLTVYCESLKNLPRKDRKKLCKEFRNLLLQI
ncbi:MAG: hypothetical protein ACTSX9_07340 [Candidatus Njordarchaeales archaeon]